jgi:hypothetical protein
MQVRIGNIRINGSSQRGRRLRSIACGRLLRFGLLCCIRHIRAGLAWLRWLAFVPLARFLVIRFGLKELHQVAEGPHRLLALLHAVGDGGQRLRLGFEFQGTALTGTLRARLSRRGTTVAATTILARLAAGAAFSLPAALRGRTGALS